MSWSNVPIKNRYPGFYYFWITVVIAFLFALLEPEATRGIAFIPRLAQWFISVGLVLVILINIHMLLQRSSWFNSKNSWLKLCLSGLAGAILFSPMDVAIDILVGLDTWPYNGGVGEKISFLFEDMLTIIPPVIVAWVAINAPRILQLNFSYAAANKARTQAKVEHIAENTETGMACEPGTTGHQPTEPAIFSMLPPCLGKEIIYVKSELHYLQVVTLQGKSLILFNLKDAVEQLSRVIPGIQTHRSYWVAERMIEDIVRQDGKTYLKAVGDHMVPVSRRNVTGVKEHFSTILSVKNDSPPE